MDFFNRSSSWFLRVTLRLCLFPWEISDCFLVFMIDAVVFVFWMYVVASFTGNAVIGFVPG